MDFERLNALGWKPLLWPHFEPYVEQGCVPARVGAASHNIYRVIASDGEHFARVAGKLQHRATSRSDYPVVGDWVAVALPDGSGTAVIHGLLPRQTRFSRKVAGEHTEEQVLAANIDVLFIVTSLTREFNLRRLERYLILAHEGGSQSVIVLNKADLCPDPSPRLAEVRGLAGHIPVHLTAAATGDGVDDLQAYLPAGTTAAFVGSSGVGKSTLLNRIAGRDIQAVRDVRSDDDRGRHTTTQSSLIRLPGGGWVIDTPGLREVQLWEAEEGFEAAFQEIRRLSNRCRFRDCRHLNEPGCAVLKALDDGDLDPERYENYLKLRREHQFLKRRREHRAMIEEKQRRKRMNKAMRGRGRP